MTNNFAEAEILFGSLVRGDNDKYSDRDILIIDEDFRRLSSRKEELSQNGYSVGSYSWNRLRKIAENGSLFIQHLKTEGHITNDKEGKLTKLLGDFSPKNSYEKELVQNDALLKLLDSYPNSRRGHLWAMDLMYVTIRNFGVLSLASHKKYVFSYEEILNQLAEQ